MLADDVQFEGFTHEDWTRVLELFTPLRPGGRDRAADRPRGTVVAVHQDGRLKKLLHSRVGRLRLDDLSNDWPIDAEELAQRHDASLSLVLEVGALDEAMEDFGRKVRAHHDFAEQSEILLGALQRQMRSGRVTLWPHRLAGVPIPTPAMTHRTLDLLCPRGKTFLLGLFDGDSLWTSIALRRGAKGIDMILGPDELREGMGLLSGDFRRDHRHLARVVSDYTGPLSFGCFSDYRTFRRLEVDPSPGAWASAVAVRDVVLSPVPPAMAVPLGLDAGRAAFSALRHVTARLDRSQRFGPAFNALKDIARRQSNVIDALGFQPLELLRLLLSREQ